MVLRSLAFNIAFYVNLVGWLLACLPGIVLPRRWTMSFLHNWARSSLWLLEHVAGIRVEVRGGAHMRGESLIVGAKHQSLFETFALLPYLADPAFILKRELNWIPLFGWWAMKFGMIPVHRGKGSQALKAMTARARREVRSGRQIVLFPEGTRRPPGAEPQYKVGIGFVYEACEVPCVPVALNSGLYWPRRKWRRHPGTILVEFLEPIPPGLPRAELLETLQVRIEAASDRLLLEAASGPNPPPLPETARRRIAELTGGAPPDGTNREHMVDPRAVSHDI